MNLKNTHIHTHSSTVGWKETSTDLVLAVGEVDSKDAHSMEDKLHRGQEVIQHCRLEQ